MLFRQILTLARVPNLPTVWSNVLLAWTLAGGGCGWGLLAALAGGTLLYAGGCTLNDAFDAAWDRQNKPDRLIASGEWSERGVWGLGLFEMVAGLALFILARPDAWAWPAGLAAAIVVYDFRHKQTPWSVVVMGACRALLVLAGAAVTGAGWDWRVLVAAGVLWIYIIALSLLARRESRPGGGFLKKLLPHWSVGRWVGEMLAAIPLLDSGLLLLLGLILHGQSAAIGGVGVGRLPVEMVTGTAAVCFALWPLCRLLQVKFKAT